MSKTAQIWGRFGLGTRLRLLQERLNKDVDQFYLEHKINFKTRYFAVFKLLKNNHSMTIKQLSEKAGTSHSAMSQTITSMVKMDYLSLCKGEDAREKVVKLTTVGEAVLTQVKPLWEHINSTNELMMSEFKLDFYAALEQLETALDESSLLERLKTNDWENYEK